MGTEHLARNIIELRTQRHMTQKGLAELAGITGGALNNLEQGKRGGSIDTLVKVAAALDVTIDALLADSPCRHVRIGWLVPDENLVVVCSDCGAEWAAYNEEGH